ncbi:hypothetical protein NMG60_11018244 [Bertholletia excelsa]
MRAYASNSQHFSFFSFDLDPWNMGADELISIDPLELKFPFELKKQISSSFQLLNMTDNHVAFKVKTTNPKKYFVRPNNGIVLPRSTSNVMVTMQAQREAPPDMQCKDKFLVQSVVARPGATPKDITPEMFNKEAGNHVRECKLRVVYVSPPKPPSPVPEEPEEGSSPRAAEFENRYSNSSEFATVFRERVEVHDSATQARALFSKLTEEKNHAAQQIERLRRELELLRHGRTKSSIKVPFLYVVLIALLGILVGYYMTNS